MSPPPLFAGNRLIRIGARIGKGGEGEVYAIEGVAGHAVKFYTVADVLDRQPKIVAMIRAGLASGSDRVAYPSEAVSDARGMFAGFVMKLVSGHQPIHHLYSTVDRKTHYPSADYRFLVRTAVNVARALAEVHARGCVIGDINHSGILVSDRATIALIDADSFQLSEGGTQYLCAVGTQEYTPPELQGASLNGIVRTPNHDAFGLAVILFQLLFMGRQPFSGSYQAAGDMPLEKAISEYRFAYSLKRAVGMRPPPATPLLSDFPPPVAQAFETAFDRGTKRPTAAEWVGVLERLESQLRRCPDNDLHYFPGSAAACPWCRMELASPGLILFLPPLPPQSAATATSTPGVFDLRSVWAAIEAVQLPPATPPDPLLPDLDVVASDAAVAAAGTVTARKGWAIVVLAGSVIGTAVATPALIVWLGLGLVGLIMLFGRPKAARAFHDRALQADRQWTQALADWERRCGGPELAANKKALGEARRQLEALPGELRTQLANYDAHRRDFQLRSHLENHRVSAAKIRGVGPGLKAALASWGIDSALNVSYAAVIRIDGFGQAKATAMDAWRRQVEARFVYDPRPNAADTREKDRINREANHKGARLREKLGRGANDLRVASQTVLMRWKLVDQPLVRAQAERLQALADDDIVNPTVGARLKRMSSLAWTVLIMAMMAAVFAMSRIEMPVPHPEAPPVAGSTPELPGMQRFDPPKGFVVAPKAGIPTVNAREAPDGDAVVEKLKRGASFLAIGRSIAFDGSGWIAFIGPNGTTEFVSEKVLRPALSGAADAAGACAGKNGVAAILCKDPTIRNLDDQLNDSYREIRSRTSGDERRRLVVGERDWLSQRDACAGSPDAVRCLAEAYHSRLAELSATAAAPAPRQGAATQAQDPVPVVAPPAAGAPAVQAPPRPRGSPGEWITPDDYPPSALRAGEAGRVTFTLHVEQSGAVDGCDVVQSSGFADLDQTTCRLVQRRARFAPASDPTGQPIDASWTSSVDWKIPGQ